MSANLFIICIAKYIISVTIIYSVTQT